MSRYLDEEAIKHTINKFIDETGSDVFTREHIFDFLWETDTADVQETRHGHWFFTEYDFFDCSICGNAYFNGCDSTAEAKERLKKKYDLFKYCPHCGARMDGDTK